MSSPKIAIKKRLIVIRKNAFNSPVILRKTILHELGKLNTSNFKRQKVIKRAVSGKKYFTGLKIYCNKIQRIDLRSLSNLFTAIFLICQWLIH